MCITCGLVVIVRDCGLCSLGIGRTQLNSPARELQKGVQGDNGMKRAYRVEKVLGTVVLCLFAVSNEPYPLWEYPCYCTLYALKLSCIKN